MGTKARQAGETVAEALSGGSIAAGVFKILMNSDYKIGAMAVIFGMVVYFLKVHYKYKGNGEQ